ncbi:MAG: VWA domain-containing protein, partial [Marinibacterium sp.]|nr:VWA domain-containing protein [Marinibacterium sp.]
ALSVGGSLSADTISPEVVETDLRLEDKTVIRKVVTVEAGPPASATLDVVFLSDTTGSMGGVIRQVQRNATRILSDLAALGSVRYGVAEYRDHTERYAYRINTPLTTDANAVKRGLGQWSPNGGGDQPEANLFGLNETALKMDWRDQAVRVIIWFGDAPGHDPSRGVGMGRVLSELNGRSIVVHAIDSNQLNMTRQASRIADGTGGRVWSVGSTDGVVNALIGAVETTLENYSEVRLEFGDEPLGLGITITPDKYEGAFKRDRDRTYEFQMELEAFKPGLYEFEVDALVDGSKVATEQDRITVPNLPPVRD